MQSGKVVAYTDEILLRDVEYLVSENGMKRVRREGRKNVHAFLVGYITSMFGVEFLCMNCQEILEVDYNPYKNESFVDNCNNTVLQSDYALMSIENGIRAMWSTV